MEQYFSLPFPEPSRFVFAPLLANLHTESKYEGPLCEPSNNSFLSANCQAQFFSGPPPPFILTRPNIRGFFGKFCPVSELIIQHSAKWRTLGWTRARGQREAVRGITQPNIPLLAENCTGSVSWMSNRKWNYSRFGATHSIKRSWTESNSISGATFCILPWYINCL